MQAFRSARVAEFATGPTSRLQLLRMRVLTALLHALQPVARLYGRLSRGLPSWRCSVRTRPRLPLPRRWALWTTRWADPQERLRGLEQRIKGAGARVRRGGDYDRWDIEVEVGALVCARLLMAVEEHGGGAQLVRWRVFSRCPAGVFMVGGILGILTLAAGINHAGVATFTFAGLVVALAGRLVWEAALALGAITDAIKHADRGATTLSRRGRLGRRG